MSENDFRQCLRIATGATIGFTLCKVFGWNYGVFFTVTPMLLLGMVPVMSCHAARQLIFSAVVCGLEVGILGGLFGGHPGMMTIIAFGLFLYKFACMSKGSLFLFGANSVLSLSIMLHFASYPTTDLNDLIFGNLQANVISVIVAYVVTFLIPDAEPVSHRPNHLSLNRITACVMSLMGASIATMSFLVFQLFDLSDSMSAQATTLLLLFPMHWNGALGYARKRAMGGPWGVTFGIAGQLVLYDWSDTLLFIVPLLWIGAMMFSYMHVKESSGSGAGFGGLTTLGILFGQYLTPDGDLMFSALYRVSSILFAIVVTLLVTYAVHRVLNSFEATRFSQQ
ncbi:LOW QUALITY PROTEIN: permease [Vibrio sp. JCM 18905]|nr:LOW QUALITY PROTEIN: permease [Vibrio sp. JCM 18905]